ncbi:hypothetical protein [Sphingomonas sanguinis]|uniref:Uncharacterized protein n=1 Tax=Sphingomonas sanguinis TaxID=33051 RepID=A0A147J2K4_9SPHN|nr:hypothetical protein [Sphingomonas sanguinis]KTW02921.1 hypothetical protein SB4_01990 [Sphingomonas sanguinis]
MMMGTFDRPPVFPMPDLPRCVVPGAGPVVGRMGALPEPVRLAVVAAVGGPVAEAGAPFQVSDMVRPDSPPRTRFLRAYRVRDRWLVWVEQGGIGHGFRVLAFRDAPQRADVPVTVSGGGKGKLCTVSLAVAAK